jgi:GH18 family chitinase
VKKTLLVVAVTLLARYGAAGPATILTNHLGYERTGAKRAVIQGPKGVQVRGCVVEDSGGGTKIPTSEPRYVGPVAHWRDWAYWTVDFSSVERDGTFVLVCATASGELRSSVFRIEPHVFERRTLSNVVYYFKGQRSSGLLDEADRNVPFEGAEGRKVDVHGGWYDATGDYGKYLSHLSYATYFNPQQAPLTTWGLLKTYELLQRRSDPAFRQYLRRILDEGAWGADYLVRAKAPNGSFYRSVSAPGPGKRPEDRRIGRDAKAMAIKENQSESSSFVSADSSDNLSYESSLRAGAGVAIAALARAAAMGAPGERRADYLRAAEEAWAFLAKSNALLTNDGEENIIDDYCGLLAATELFEATRKAEYKKAADERAAHLMGRLAPAPKSYWRADGGDRPFFHASDAGLPVTSLLSYLEIADPEQQPAVLSTVRASLEWELKVTGEVPNPFGYARQLVQTKTGSRNTRFFFPHDTEAAPWWQGEDARLASLAAAARLAIPRFSGDAAFAKRLGAYADDQLNWILGLNPFDASLLGGTGHNNPEYLFFDSYEYTNAPGGIVNGITAGFTDPDGIDFNLPHTVTGADHDWRWGEQWLPHATWYLVAVAAGDGPIREAASAGADGRAIIGYVFAKDQVIDPKEVAAESLTHINYAFANVRDGRVVEGFAKDAENFQILAGLRKRNPHLKLLVSVGGWTWSGGFSDAALTSESRRRFVESAVDFVRRYDLDGLDIDWEYPGLAGLNNSHRPEDKENFTALMADLRAALDLAGRPTSRHYLLTFAAGASPEFLEHTEMDRVQASVDFVNLMAYDFREADADKEAGHHANLYGNPRDPKGESVDRAVREFLNAGVLPAKLVLGVPFYGRAWGDVKSENNGLYEPGHPVGEPVDTGYGSLAEHFVDRNGYARKWDGQADAPFLWNAEKRVFISYDDPESLRVKCRYIRDRALGGAMFWEYYADRSGALLATLFGELKKNP